MNAAAHLTAQGMIQALSPATSKTAGQWIDALNDQGEVIGQVQKCSRIFIYRLAGETVDRGSAHNIESALAKIQSAHNERVARQRDEEETLSLPSHLQHLKREWQQAELRHLIEGTRAFPRPDDLAFAKRYAAEAKETFHAGLLAWQANMKRHRADLRGLRAFHQNQVMGARLS